MAGLDTQEVPESSPRMSSASCCEVPDNTPRDLHGTRRTRCNCLCYSAEMPDAEDGSAFELGKT